MTDRDTIDKFEKRRDEDHIRRVKALTASRAQSVTDAQVEAALSAFMNGDHDKAGDDIKTHWRNSMRAALEAAQLPARPVVKALEWEQMPEHPRRYKGFLLYSIDTKGALKHYRISYVERDNLDRFGRPWPHDAPDYPRYELNTPIGSDDSHHATLDEAKAAAQADYEHRILSALSSKPEAVKNDRCQVCTGAGHTFLLGVCQNCDGTGVQPPTPASGAQMEGDDAIHELYLDALAEAEKAMRKFPQPNYVISKVAEEAGEVVKAAIHCAEGRETHAALVGEIRQAMAMLIRLYIEGDQVHGLSSPRAALADQGAQKTAGGTKYECPNFVQDPCGSARCANCGDRRGEGNHVVRKPEGAQS